MAKYDIEDIKRLDIKEGDIIVVKIDREKLGYSKITDTCVAIRRALSDNKISNVDVILAEKDTELEVIRKDTGGNND